MSSVETCVACGTPIPEGLQSCPICKSGIIRVTPDKASEIIEMRWPRGKYVIFTNGAKSDLYIGIDNTTGDAWTEEFTSLRKCNEWLDRTIERMNP